LLAAACSAAAAAPAAAEPTAAASAATKLRQNRDAGKCFRHLQVDRLIHLIRNQKPCGTVVERNELYIDLALIHRAEEFDRVPVASVRRCSVFFSCACPTPHRQD
jgi:hypothetical protein